MPTLRVARGRSTADEFPFDKELLIGRAEECHVRVFDEAASRRHAAIRRDGTDWVVEDLGSRNGTFVNGVRVTRQRLRTGDEIAVRGLALLFVGDGAFDRPTAAHDAASSVESRVEPARARVRGAEDDLVRRLAAVYRVAAILSGEPARVRGDLLRALEEIFAPCRVGLVLPDGDAGVHSRSVVDLARASGEAVLVRDRKDDLPGAASVVASRIRSAMAAPLRDAGALYVDRITGDPFAPEDLELLAALAHAAAPVLHPPAPRTPPSAGDEPIAGESAAVRALREELARAAPTSATVLVTGETGTGKELVARALHALSPRARGPFVAVNCAAFVESLLEAELFGHEKGAFTGADRARPGRFEQAHGGTLFLDEVGELAEGLQAKLLRVLETREFHRLGATKPTRVDVRIVAASNRDLHAGGFREDLYYRLSVVTIRCPPLRDREGDVRLLAQRFLAGRKRFSEEAMRLLEAYAWPGNVRELRNVCERCAVMAPGETIGTEDLPLEVRIGRTPGSVETAEVKTLREMEREMVVRALAKTAGNRTQAAKLLGISYPTLKKKIDEFGL